MAKGTRICKICGKEYPYCTTVTPFDGNRWQDVACCEEHAMEYYKQVAISRGEITEEKPKNDVPAKAPFEFMAKVKGVKKSEDNETEAE